MANPFLTYPGVLERSSHLTHTYLPNDPMVVGYQYWGQTSISGAYGNPVGSGVGGAGASALFQVSRNIQYRSSGIRRRGLGAIPESHRGTTHAVFDIEDFVAPGDPIPADSQWAYLRVQENRTTSGLLTVPGPFPVLGGIVLVPPASAYGAASITFTEQGVAPSATGCAVGAVPLFNEDLTAATPRPLLLVFPLPLTEFTLKNLDAAKSILVSFGPSQPMLTLPAGQETQLFSGSTKSLVLACPNAGGCAFALHGTMTR